MSYFTYRIKAQLYMPLFSVVVTVYNKEIHIFNTLKSVVDQTFTDIEIIVVNDGSTDDSLQEIEKINHASISVHSTKNQGVSSARNFGIEQAKGKYIALLDGDDYWYPFHLEALAELIKKHPSEKIFAAACEVCCSGKTKPYNYSIDANKYLHNYFEASLQNSILNSSNIVFEKSVYNEMGGFLTSFSNYEDIEYWFRIGLRYRVAFSSKTAVRINRNTESLSNKSFNMQKHYFFDDYDAITPPNQAYKTVLNLNLYSLALLCKEYSFTEKFTETMSRIDFSTLALSKKIIINLPSGIIRFLKKRKTYF